MSAPIHSADLASGLDAFCGKRLPEAFSILEPLAENGNSDAQLIMGLRYFYGLDGKRDRHRARKWYAKAAEQGDAEAQVLLGLMFAEGDGGKVDFVEAVRWFRKAAEAGYSAGQYNLGLAYQSGQGAPQDAVKGSEWYQKAAEQGYEWAQTNLGSIDVSAGQTSASKVIGCKWLLLASGKGDGMATKLLEVQRPLMTEDDLREAKRLADQFEPTPTAVTQLVSNRCRTHLSEGSGS
jgi:TPR repeat protein